MGEDGFRRPYGLEAILDLTGCDPETFGRRSLDRYFTELCALISMEKQDVHFWDDEGRPPEECQTHPDTKGTSAICFILTSSIVVHALDLRREVFVDIFSCKEFDAELAKRFTEEWFRSEICRMTVVVRGE